ncbi:hypothetical protein E6O75_ATG01602 [Venturia nashicola]|uniref:Uncharacterized protein n=1 Tax=Venturia nashicola TaxID=86259 RepID=A0A4Z1NY52_9PEZI|nr:hypothetical protein E6O75_ATG01602 [Venturia nashicola]
MPPESPLQTLTPSKLSNKPPNHLQQPTQNHHQPTTHQKMNLPTLLTLTLTLTLTLPAPTLSCKRYKRCWCQSTGPDGKSTHNDTATQATCTEPGHYQTGGKITWPTCYRFKDRPMVDGPNDRRTGGFRNLQYLRLENYPTSSGMRFFPHLMPHEELHDPVVMEELLTFDLYFHGMDTGFNLDNENTLEPDWSALIMPLTFHAVGE